MDYGHSRPLGDKIDFTPGTDGFRADEVRAAKCCNQNDQLTPDSCLLLQLLNGESIVVTEAIDVFSLGCLAQAVIKSSEMSPEVAQLVDCCLKVRNEFALTER